MWVYQMVDPTALPDFDEEELWLDSQFSVGGFDDGSDVAA